MIYSCCNEKRKNAVLGSTTLNGIDYIEVLDHDDLSLGNSPRQQTLLVHCLNNAPTGLNPSNVLISGGESITGITALWVAPASPPPPLANSQEQQYFSALVDKAKVLVVRTNTAGDFSPYVLRLVNDATKAVGAPVELKKVLDGFDMQLADVQFSFKVECGPEFDCASPLPNCSAATAVPPPINYLAKDYGSFRTLMLDRLNQLAPAWGGTSEADFGVALVELMAYVGDRLSYQQDAVATEAYVETARSRVSLRRHAVLVDYPVHDGCNARAWIQIQVAGNPGDPVFLDHTLTRFYTFAPGMPSSLAVGSNNEEAAVLAGVQIFEPMSDAILFAEQNQMNFYTWGDENCCLPAGATEATLSGTLATLQTGDVLIFQEVLGPQTGAAADADIRHRWAVRLTNVTSQDDSGNPLVDPLFKDANSNPQTITEIQWSADDAHPFPLCISSGFVDQNGKPPPSVSVAFGNVVLADHGVSVSNKTLPTVKASRLSLPPDPAVDGCNPPAASPLPVRYRPLIPDSPLTQAVPAALGGSGSPVATGVQLLPRTGSVSLTTANGSASLALEANDSAVWPTFFGVLVADNASYPGIFDLSVVYNPAGGAAGFPTQQSTVVEKFTNISVNTTDRNYVTRTINANSNLIQVPPRLQ